jgi:arylsulfatase A-like enzyme
MRQPNILFLFTDQQRFNSIQALGTPWMKTPNLDRLCREGTAFTSAYTPAAECVPARCCLITGNYVHHHGCASNAESMPPEDTPTFMSRLADAGYRTHGVGKCHFTPNSAAMRGFQTRDISEEIPKVGEKDDYADFVKEKGYGHVVEPIGIRGEMYYIPQPSQVPEEVHHSHWVADRCIDFIQGQKEKDQPWMLYGGFIHPHPPFAPPNPWHKMYRAPDMPLPYLPEDDGSLTCFINRFQNRYKYRDRGLDLNLVRCIRAYYAACISFMDYQVGRILNQLEAQGELDNTLIVFSSDHGELLGDFGCFGKRSFHDATSRIPLIARWPDHFPAGKKCQHPASLVDIAPTFLAAAGLDEKQEDTLEGVDLSTLANDTCDREAVFFQYHRGENAGVGVVTEDFKYAWSAPDQRAYLFSRDETPEAHNLAGASEHKQNEVKLKAILVEHLRAGNFADELLSDTGAFVSAPIRKMPEDPDEGLLFQDPLGFKAKFPLGF